MEVQHHLLTEEEKCTPDLHMVFGVYDGAGNKQTATESTPSEAWGHWMKVVQRHKIPVTG